MIYNDNLPLDIHGGCHPVRAASLLKSNGVRRAEANQTYPEYFLDRMDKVLDGGAWKDRKSR